MRYDKTVCGIVLAMSLSTSVNAAFYVHDAFGNLRTIDVSTREVQLVGNMGVVLTDIAFDPHGRLFGLSFSNFYEIDPTTAQVTLIGPHSIPCGNALEFKDDGTLYGAGCSGGSLFTIDTATGVGTPIGNIGYSAFGDLAFNNGRLYLAESGDRLVEIDLSSGAVASVVGPLGFSRVWGLDTDSNGTLLGFSETNVLSIDTTTGAGTLVFDYRGPDVQQAYGASSTFTESVSPPKHRLSLIAWDELEPQ